MVGDLPLAPRGMPLKQPSEETGDADAFNEEKKRKEKWEASFENKNVWNLLLYSMKCMGNG